MSNPALLTSSPKMDSDSDPLRVVIVDHSVVARTGLGALLACQPSIEVVGQAPDGTSGLDVIARTKADVALVDLEMPDMSGLDVMRALGDETKVLIITFRQELHHVAGAIRAGVRGYLVFQDLRADELVTAIHTVANGGTALSQCVTPHVFDLLRDSGSRHERPSTGRHGLTPRESQTMDLVARGMTNAEVAAELCLSVKTVKNSMANIYRRLNVSHRSAAIATWLGTTAGARP